MLPSTARSPRRAPRGASRCSSEPGTPQRARAPPRQEPACPSQWKTSSQQPDVDRRAPSPILISFDFDPMLASIFYLKSTVREDWKPVDFRLNLCLLAQIKLICGCNKFFKFFPRCSINPFGCSVMVVQASPSPTTTPPSVLREPHAGQSWRRISCSLVDAAAGRVCVEVALFRGG